jgi:hypothetical protein
VLKEQGLGKKTNVPFVKTCQWHNTPKTLTTMAFDFLHMYFYVTFVKLAVLVGGIIIEDGKSQFQSLLQNISEIGQKV